MLKKQGITLVTIVVAITIIFIITTATIVSVSNIISDASIKTFAMEIYSVQKLVDEYKMKNNGKLDFTVKTYQISDLATGLREPISEEEGTSQGSVNLYVLDKAALDKLGVDELRYGAGGYDAETDRYVVSCTSGRVYYLYGFEERGQTYYCLTPELADVLYDNMRDNLDNTQVVFIPTTSYKSPKALSVKVKVPNGADVSTIDISIDKAGITISDYVEEMGYYVYTVNTEEVVGNYTIEVTYTVRSEEKNAKYNTEGYMRSVCSALFRWRTCI